MTLICKSNKGTSKKCHERPKCQTDRAEKPERTQSTRGFRAPANAAIWGRNKFLEEPNKSFVVLFQHTAFFGKSVENCIGNIPGEVGRNHAGYLFDDIWNLCCCPIENLVTLRYGEFAVVTGRDEMLPLYPAQKIMTVLAPHSHRHPDFPGRKHRAAMSHDRVCRQHVVKRRQSVPAFCAEKKAEVFCMAVYRTGNRGQLLYNAVQ